MSIDETERNESGVISVENGRENSTKFLFQVLKDSKWRSQTHTCLKRLLKSFLSASISVRIVCAFLCVKKNCQKWIYKKTLQKLTSNNCAPESRSSSWDSLSCSWSSRTGQFWTEIWTCRGLTGTKDKIYRADYISGKSWNCTPTSEIWEVWNTRIWCTLTSFVPEWCLSWYKSIHNSFRANSKTIFGSL